MRAICVAALLFSVSLAASGLALDKSSLQKELSEFPRSSDPDVALFAKAVEWILRHDEFYADDYLAQSKQALDTGRERAAMLREGRSPWRDQIGMTVRAYRSRVDDSIQPYAVTLPVGFDIQSKKRWPLHVVLHGRAGKMNEVNFIHKYNNKPAHEENSGWIQLDVFGRTNNAYRWSGETDVFEAIEAVRTQYKIDDDRVVLRGFSMGGAGAWHLGMHFSDLWCSVGPGAGFVDFYKYQKQTSLRPPHQHVTLGIYDAIDYSMNAFNVPTCTYGGENDPQLAAGQLMHDAAKRLGIDIKLIIGPGMGHKFDSASRKEFMAFHVNAMKRGRVYGDDRKEIRFATRTLRYNQCDWITVEEQKVVYQPTHVHAIHNDGTITIATENVRALRIDFVHESCFLRIDAQQFDISDKERAAVFMHVGGRWKRVGSEGFASNKDLHKRHGLQGPIDDAFMDRFICVQGSREPWADSHEAYTKFLLRRFATDYDKWLRAKVPIHGSKTFDVAMADSHHVILFGDPGSNPAIADIVAELPIEWTRDEIKVNGQSYPTKNHALSMIYPHPRSPKRYVVINSGHTIYEPDFKNSNSWLFPRLGDIAVRRFSQREDGTFSEQTVWAANFDADWKLGEGLRETR